MDKGLFEELLGSLHEAKAIAKGKAKASRRFEFDAPDAKAVREQTAIAERVCAADAGERQDAAELGAASAQPDGASGCLAQDRRHGA